MPDLYKNSRTVDDVLQSTSEVLFPAEIGEHIVAIDSRGSDGDTPLHTCTWRNDVEGVRLLVEAGANVNAVGDMGQTALHVALTQGHADIAAILIAADADVDIRSEFGKSCRDLMPGGLSSPDKV